MDDLLLMIGAVLVVFILVSGVFVGVTFGLQFLINKILFYYGLKLITFKITAVLMLLIGAFTLIISREQ